MMIISVGRFTNKVTRALFPAWTNDRSSRHIKPRHVTNGILTCNREIEGCSDTLQTNTYSKSLRKSEAILYVYSVFSIQILNTPLYASVRPFQANVPFLYPLKMSENLWFFDVFRGYKKGTLSWNGLTFNETPSVHKTIKNAFHIVDNRRYSWKSNWQKRHINQAANEFNNTSISIPCNFK